MNHAAASYTYSKETIGKHAWSKWWVDPWRGSRCVRPIISDSKSCAILRPTFSNCYLIQCLCFIQLGAVTQIAPWIKFVKMGSAGVQMGLPLTTVMSVDPVVSANPMRVDFFAINLVAYIFALRVHFFRLSYCVFFNCVHHLNVEKLSCNLSD